ncbi:MAG: hypothetical protein OCU16_00670 [Candidatus Methanospirare jalkutatii]|nr:hypothetical protein [Candidatus Methanospirare jalkutatii]
MSVANEQGRASHMWKEGLEAGKEKEVLFLTDGGATYTLLPRVAGNLKTGGSIHSSLRMEAR